LDCIKKLQHCQKGQYMLIRLPPHCSVTWKHHADYQTSFRRYHSKESWMEKIVQVCYSPTSFWWFC
jgi:hypothetical protein